MIIFPTYKLIFLKQINTNSFYGLYKKAKIYRALYFIIKKRYRGNQFILINSISFIFKLLKLDGNALYRRRYSFFHSSVVSEATDGLGAAGFFAPVAFFGES